MRLLLSLRGYAEPNFFFKLSLLISFCLLQYYPFEPSDVEVDQIYIKWDPPSPTAEGETMNIDAQSDTSTVETDNNKDHEMDSGTDSGTESDTDESNCEGENEEVDKLWQMVSKLSYLFSLSSADRRFFVPRSTDTATNTESGLTTSRATITGSLGLSQKVHEATFITTHYHLFIFDRIVNLALTTTFNRSPRLQNRARHARSRVRPTRPNNSLHDDRLGELGPAQRYLENRRREYIFFPATTTIASVRRLIVFLPTNPIIATVTLPTTPCFALA